MTTKKNKYFVFAILPLLLSSCIGLKHLKENEKLLYRQGVQAPKDIDKEKLHDLYAQKANRKILAMPISPLVSVYYLGANQYDQQKFIKKKEAVIKKFDDKIANTSSEKKITRYQFRKQKKVTRLTKTITDGNHLMQWGEPIAVYDSSQVKLTLERYHDYLFSKGYFNNRVTSKETILGKLVSISYKIDPGQPYIIDSIFYQLKDSTIFNIIDASSKSSFLKKGEKYDQDNIINEQERLDLLLKDHGYFDFSRQYIDFKVDTALLGKKRIAVLVVIKDPAKRGYHRQFDVDSVVFTTDVGAKVTGSIQRQNRRYRNVNFTFFKRDYNLKILSQRVFIYPDSLYNRGSTITTQRQLANLDAFKFVNINYDTSYGKFVANIFASPLDRYQWSNEAGVNVTQGFPGPFDNLTFKKRNVFGGLETFELTGRFGFEGVASATDDQNIYKSTESGINGVLTFPQFLWPFREKTQIRLGRYNPKTKISSGYSYTDRPDYTRQTTSINHNYSWERGRSKRFDFTLINVSIINSHIKTKAFTDLLNTLQDQGNNLKRSFNRSFVSSMIFGMTWNHNNYGNKDKSSVFLRWQIESGGTLQNIFRYSFISKDSLQLYRYIRASIDYRKNIVLNKNTTLAYRLNGGIAYSYGDTLKVLPYEKYFFAGGSNGIRAWRPRRLGQGSLEPKTSLSPKSDGRYDYSFEKPGDILLEGSIELRKHLIGFIEGAVFVDVGNVWYLFPQKERNPGNSQFKIDSFFKQIGVGTGFGLRFDFSFLIIRLDVGMKAYDPAQGKFVLNKARFAKPYATENGVDENGNKLYTNFKEPVIYNFGIGYSF